MRRAGVEEETPAPQAETGRLEAEAQMWDDWVAARSYAEGEDGFGPRPGHDLKIGGAGAS
jgi:hypothetical protein